MAHRLCHWPQPTNRICFSIHSIQGIWRNTEYWTELSSKRVGNSIWCIDEGGWVLFWCIPIKKASAPYIRDIYNLIEMVDFFFNRKLISISRSSISLYLIYLHKVTELGSMDPKFILFGQKWYKHQYSHRMTGIKAQNSLLNWNKRFISD